MPSEVELPGDYAKSNVDKVAPRLKGVASLTAVSPSGFGKSSLLRYLTFNKKYRSRFPNLKDIEFIYVDLTDIQSEAERLPNQVNGVIINNTDQQEIIKKTILKSINKKLDRSISKSDLPLDQSLEEAMKLLTKAFRRKVFYFCLDGTDHLLTINPMSNGSFLKSFRDQYKGRVEYLFTLTNINFLENLKHEYYGGLANIISHQISVLSLIPLRETFRFRSSGINGFLDNHFKINSSSTQEWLNKISKITGDYFPYSRYFLSLNEIPEKIPLTFELQMATQNLLKSLTPNQIKILRDIAMGKAVKNTIDLNFLLQTGLVKQDKIGLSLFSQIIKDYFSLEE